MDNEIFLMLNLGLGDGIICNGLIRTLALEYDKIFIPCYEHNFPSVSFMLSDLPNVTVQPCGEQIRKAEYDHNCAGRKILRLGMYSGEPHREPETFDQTFYRQAGIEFSKRWDAFGIPEASQCPVASKQYSMICDSRERGFNIDKTKASLPLIEMDFSHEHTIFAFCDMMKNATELHCINSAPSILADSIPTNGKLFLHRYARPYTPYDCFKIRKNWTILD